MHLYVGKGHPDLATLVLKPWVDLVVEDAVLSPFDARASPEEEKARLKRNYIATRRAVVNHTGWFTFSCFFPTCFAVPHTHTDARTSSCTIERVHVQGV